MWASSENHKLVRWGQPRWSGVEWSDTLASGSVEVIRGQIRSPARDQHCHGSNEQPPGNLLRRDEGDSPRRVIGQQAPHPATAPPRQAGLFSRISSPRRNLVRCWLLEFQTIHYEMLQILLECTLNSYGVSLL